MLSLTNEQIDEIIYQIPLQKGIPQRVAISARNKIMYKLYDHLNYLLNYL